MPDGRQFSLQIRIGSFILAGLGVFLAIIYLLGAQARYFERKYELIAEFTEVGGLIEGATVRLAGVQIGRVTGVSLPPQPGGKVRVTLNAAVERVERAGTLDDLGATAKSARRITAQVEKGHGLLHALVYEEPEALRRLNTLLSSTQDLLSRAQSGDSAVSALLSPESGKAARSLLAAMEALGRGAEKAGTGEGVLSALLFDPEYRVVAEDLRTVARNFRDVSEKLANGQGLLGELVYGGGG